MDHYEQDAATFASWGVDYIKFDWCGDVKDKIWLGPSLHREFAAAVLATGRPMFLEVCTKSLSPPAPGPSRLWHASPRTRVAHPSRPRTQ